MQVVPKQGLKTSSIAFNLLFLMPQPTLKSWILFLPQNFICFSGWGNKILDALNERWGADRAFQWVSSNLIVQQSYHGGCLEGNQVKMLLQKAGQLKTALPSKLKKFAIALEQFETVTTSCFSTLLKTSFEQDVANFKASFLRLDINVTPKVHCVFSHVPDFCRRKRAGLGRFSEQASEAVHHDFKERWAHYAVPEKHPKYGEK